MTFDNSVHLIEVVCIIFWIGFSYSDLQHLKRSVERIENFFFNNDARKNYPARREGD